MTSKFIKHGSVRTRIAPSPTGFLHIGTARTALFNYLFSKKYQGQFVLRIEDTDLERSDKKFEEDIIAGLKWLGINWDEGPLDADSRGFNADKRGNYIGEYGPYRQSERLDTYSKYIQRLLDESKAYYCFCSEEELEAQRASMMADGRAPIYSGKCRNLSQEEIAQKMSGHDTSKGERAGGKYIIRFKMPDKKIAFNDIVRGKLEFDTSLIGDITIAKNISTPLYNFAVVVDDFEMKITHIIRGEDHISNTPKQIAICEALNFSIPEYIHLPLILGPDRSKMSKRHGATSIIEYKKIGFLPEALINFMALLGWNPGSDKEIFSLEQLAEEFSLDKIQKSGAIFNIQKLESINSYYIKNKSVDELFELLKPYFNEAEYKASDEKLKKIIKLEQERLKKLSDIIETAKFFFDPSDYLAEILIWKKSDKDNALSALKDILENFESVAEGDFNISNLKSILDALAEKYGGAGEVFWPLRVALSSLPSSPPPLEIAEILEKEESLKRIKIAIDKLERI